MTKDVVIVRQTIEDLSKANCRICSHPLKVDRPFINNNGYGYTFFGCDRCLMGRTIRTQLNNRSAITQAFNKLVKSYEN